MIAYVSSNMFVGTIILFLMKNFGLSGFRALKIRIFLLEPCECKLIGLGSRYFIPFFRFIHDI